MNEFPVASGMPPIAPPAATPPATASRAKIVAMATIAGAVVTNIYCTQPILPLIAQDLHVAPATADLVAGAALLGFATGLALLPLGDRYDRRKLVLGQIVLAFAFAVASALAPGVWALIGAAFSLGVVSCVPQQLVPFAAVMSAPNERGRNVGTVVTGIMVGILLGRAVSGLIAHAGWRAVYAVEAAAMVPVGIAAAWLRRAACRAPRCRMAGCSRRSGRWPARIARSANRWSCRAAFNAFWVNLAALLADGPWHLGSAWAGGFGLIGAAGALAATIGGRASDRIGTRRVIGLASRS